MFPSPLPYVLGRSGVDVVDSVDAESCDYLIVGQANSQSFPGLWQLHDLKRSAMMSRYDLHHFFADRWWNWLSLSLYLPFKIIN
jgi:hypothetical protein